ERYRVPLPPFLARRRAVRAEQPDIAKILVVDHLALLDAAAAQCPDQLARDLVDADDDRPHLLQPLSRRIDLLLELPVEDALGRLLPSVGDGGIDRNQDASLDQLIHQGIDRRMLELEELLTDLIARRRLAGAGQHPREDVERALAMNSRL